MTLLCLGSAAAVWLPAATAYARRRRRRYRFGDQSSSWTAPDLSTLSPPVKWGIAIPTVVAACYGGHRVFAYLLGGLLYLLLLPIAALTRRRVQFSPMGGQLVDLLGLLVPLAFAMPLRYSFLNFVNEGDVPPTEELILISWIVVGTLAAIGFVVFARWASGTKSVNVHKAPSAPISHQPATPNAGMPDWLVAAMRKPAPGPPAPKPQEWKNRPPGPEPDATTSPHVPVPDPSAPHVATSGAMLLEEVFKKGRNASIAQMKASLGSRENKGAIELGPISDPESPGDE